MNILPFERSREFETRVAKSPSTENGWSRRGSMRRGVGTFSNSGMLTTPAPPLAESSVPTLSKRGYGQVGVTPRSRGLLEAAGPSTVL